MQPSGEPSNSSVAGEAPAGISGQGRRVQEKTADTVVNVEDSPRCCDMADPLLAATLIGAIPGRMGTSRMKNC